MRQGDIYDVTIRQSRYRALVVSSDAHNEVRTPWLVPVARRSIDAPPYLVALADPDPIGGTADLDRLFRLQPDGEPLGTITGATMARVRDAINTLFAG